jgi:hypothetical protein
MYKDETKQRWEPYTLGQQAYRDPPAAPQDVGPTPGLPCLLSYFEDVTTDINHALHRIHLAVDRLGAPHIPEEAEPPAANTAHADNYLDSLRSKLDDSRAILRHVRYLADRLETAL